mgnify:CR=1 FL=1
MHYIFILGRNMKLSQAEIFSYFEKEDLRIISFSLRKNALLIETNKEIGNIIDNLGGVISIGKVLAFGSIKKNYILEQKTNSTILSGILQKILLKKQFQII